MGEACAKTRYRMQLRAMSPTPSHRGAPARGKWFPLLQLNHQTLTGQPGRTYLGPGDRVGDLRVPGGSAGQVHILRTGHLHLPRRGCQAACCKKERERREQARKGGVAGRRAGAPGVRRPYRSSEAGAGARVTSLRTAGLGPRRRLLYARSPGTSPRAGPGGSPAAEAAPHLPRPRGGHPESPGPAPDRKSVG